ncbi:MAG: arginine repressor [Clostridia bacterium]|jgi:transcriptional regulator of arginine metabolism|nr:arginine repressor [Clostridia bacterium]MDD3232226.1 arginine repressor [Clostridia bacterium]MDD3862282.1 arginine repressor [Clostridia bacterium]MDD4408510.1 arginine repressor [Clostridia bacterium]
MARSNRQSKILELISTKEIETQDELVSELRNLDFDITQATISRDIKELRLIKILSAETGKYKYAVVENENQAVSNKYILVFKEAVISIKSARNLCVLKTIKGMASAVCGIIDKLNLENVLGSVCGDDTVMIILPSDSNAENTTTTLNRITA